MIKNRKLKSFKKYNNKLIRVIYKWVDVCFKKKCDSYMLCRLIQILIGFLNKKQISPNTKYLLRYLIVRQIKHVKHNN